MQLIYQIVSIGKALLLGLVLPKEVFQMQHLTLLVFSHIPFPFEETMVPRKRIRLDSGNRPIMHTTHCINQGASLERSARSGCSPKFWGLT